MLRATLRAHGGRAQECEQRGFRQAVRAPSAEGPRQAARRQHHGCIATILTLALTERGVFWESTCLSLSNSFIGKLHTANAAFGVEAAAPIPAGTSYKSLGVGV